ncbi:filamentous hemagglutinin family protein, partial [Janthinobacterium sp. CG_23.3]|uniref:YDG domain-containing protein n=1 Tax=Janthinobacterium sp. CG_23.3 TaxID=3349634 RepID=UPI0038D38579
MKTQPAKVAARRPAPSRQPPLRRTCLALLIGACFGPALAQPTLPQVVNGLATFARQGNVFSITNTPNAIINWQSFSVNPGELTRFIQQSAGSSVLNRITGQDPSRILGALQSNGRVFLVNPNGVLFGRDARVDVNGLVASSLAISNGDFLAGRQRFAADGGAAGAVANQGVITTPAGGQVFLLAPQVDNSGIINAPNGEVVLAAGRSVQLADAANPALQVVVSAPADQAVNLGRVIAQGGRIGIFGALVNQRGRLSADSAVLGENGKIVLKSSNTTLLEAGSSTSATGAGRGGRVELLGRRVGLTGDASVDASGALGGGSILVGGDYRGANAAVMNAEQSYLGAGATLKADATVRGDGGKVVVWSDGATRVFGNISARGGAHGGDGGFVETSGHYLDMQGNVDTTAAKGETGQLLLDPTSIWIAVDLARANEVGMVGGAVTPDSGGNFAESGTASESLVTTGRLETLLAGSHVTVTTNNPNAAGAGHIIVVSPLAWSSGKNLSMDADGGIFLHAPISAPGATLNLRSAAGEIQQNGGAAELTVGALMASASGGGIAFEDSRNQVSGPVVLTATAGVTMRFRGALNIASANSGGTLDVSGSGPLTISGSVGSGGSPIYLSSLADIQLTSTATLDSGNGQIILQAKNMDLLGSINAGYGVVKLAPLADGNVAVGVGAVDAANTLGLSQAELQTIKTSSLLTVGELFGESSGSLAVVGNLDLSATLNANAANGNLLLHTAQGDITVAAGTQTTLAGALNLQTSPGGNYRISNAGTLKAAGINLLSGQMTLAGGVLDAPSVSLGSLNSIELGAGGVLPGALVLSAADLDSVPGASALHIEVNSANGAGDIHIGTALSRAGDLSLSATRELTATAPLSVGGVFHLYRGSWVQNDANLPGFSARDFQIDRGNTARFLRVTGGTGASGAPYQISDVYGLQGIASQGMANEYVLGADIAAAGTVNWNGGAGFVPIVDYEGRGFSGVLDGAGHAIAGLAINMPGKDDVGLFGSLTGTVKNLQLLGGSVTGRNNVGALVGQGGFVEGVFSSASVSGQGHVGGLVGLQYGNPDSIPGILKSGASGNVSGEYGVGGLIGGTYGVVQDSFALGNVTGTSNVDVSHTDLGGLAGMSVGTPYNKLINVYSRGVVSGPGFTNVGGLVGFSDGPVSNGYWNIESSGQTNGIGLRGTSASGAVAGLTEAQSMQQASFAGFEFGGSAPVWRLYEGRTGPLLKALLTPLAADVSATARREYDGSQSHFAGSIGYTGLTGGDTGADGALDYTTAARNVGTYALDGLWSTKYDITYTGNTSLTIDPRALTVGIGGSKVYDGSTGFTGAVYTINRLIDGDNVTVGGSATFLDKNAGTGKAVSAEVSLSGADIGNYSFGSGASGFADITKAVVSIATLTGVNKVYDGVTAASVSGTLSGVLGSDSVTLVAGASNFADKNVGANKSIGMSGATLGGSDAGNYALANSAGGATADISARTLNLNYSAGNKVYDGNVNASVSSSDDRVAGDVFGVSQNASFADKNAGANKKVTLASVALSGADAGNYLL